MSVSLKVCLSEKTIMSDKITDFQFQVLEAEFPILKAGAHIDVYLPKSGIRQYSVWQWNLADCTMNIAVQRESHGRGGSCEMHGLSIGDNLKLSAPRNHFPLNSTDGNIILIAGGIGITPIIPMIHKLREANSNFKVLYLTKSAQDAAFHNYLSDLNLGNRYIHHASQSGGRFDLDGFLSSSVNLNAVYICGPEGLIFAVKDMLSQHEDCSVYFEHFKAVSAIHHQPSDAFEIQIKSTGETYVVGSDESALSVLNKNGHNVEFGCSEGVCGTCIIDIVDGDICHRDSVLSDEEKAAGEYMCACVSRAKSGKLILGL